MAALYKEIRGYIDIGRLLLLLLRLLKLLPPLRHNERRWRRRPAAARGDRLAARTAAIRARPPSRSSVRSPSVAIAKR